MTYTAATARTIFRTDMKPCPECGSYHLGYQTPVKIPDDTPLDAKSLLRALARSNGELKGPVYLWCQDCHHKGPAIDCTGRTSADVGRDPVVAAEVKRLWNEHVPT